MANKYKSIDEILREERKPEYLTLSLGRVRDINRWRIQYTALYFGYFAVQVFRYLSRERLDAVQNIFLWGTAAVLVAAFFFRFVPALRALAYPWIIIVVTGMLVLVPIPGILIVAYMDRTIGKVLRRGVDQARAQAQAAAAREAEATAEGAEVETETAGAVETGEVAGEEETGVERG